MFFKNKASKDMLEVTPEMYSLTTFINRLHLVTNGNRDYYGRSAN